MRKALREMDRRDADMVQRALRAEWKVRREAFDKLQAQGHVTVMCDERPDVIRVRVADEFFADSRADFPTAHLMARLQLAVNAGQSERHRVLGENDNPFSYSDMGTRAHQQIERFRRATAKPDYMFMDEAYDFKTGGDYLFPNKSPVTATVKPKYRKGLRP